ncbi:MAG: endopeptidase La [Elusimicrobia bacterium]|nr:endopeptidase La [Candidatus Liberimonas magnetica]
MAENEDKSGKIQIPEELPVLPLRSTVVFPAGIENLSVGRANSIKLVDDASLGDKVIAVATQVDPGMEEPSENDLYKIGTAVRILKMVRLTDGTVHIMVQGFARIKLERFTQKEPYLKAIVSPVVIEKKQSDEFEPLVRNILSILERFTKFGSKLGSEMHLLSLNIKNPGIIADFIVSELNLPFEEKQKFLETADIKERLEKVNLYLNKELQVLEISSKIQADIQNKMDKTQRDYILREQMSAIKKELGEESDAGEEIKELRKKIKKANLPGEVNKEALNELDRMSKISPVSPEYTVIHTYLGWLVSLPWAIKTPDNLDIKAAKEVLDEDHYDLEKIKERILEFMAVRKLKNESKGPILCFLGPPGVGKTSLGKSIARAMGRKFIRASLGGIRDEADIRGHRRTYIGALPGRIIQGIKRAGSNNPVFMMDEIDKIGADFRGDPASALLEVLDPEQNNSFTDHYLDVPFDLSNVMFIATANVIDTVPAPLRDRMEVLTLSGYTDEEKMMIAKKYLILRQLQENGISKDKIEFTDEALFKIIHGYTREAGLRNFERELASICRKVAVEVVNGTSQKIIINQDNIAKYLGPERFLLEVAERLTQPGVAIGLAWTPAGGDILFIEASKMPGKKSLALTGQLGDVMKESANAALSFIRSHASEYYIPDNFFENNDIHIHVPAGAIPKDGPSAGVTMAVALVSLLTNRIVAPYLAMTGEITLKGNVLPVGGIKEKVLAAKRAGIKVIILPKWNKTDIGEIPEKIIEGLRFIFVENINEAIKEALQLVPETIAP